MASFDFLYDDEAPGPVEQVRSALNTLFTSAKEKTDSALQTKTGQNVTSAASAGLVIGVGLGVVILVAGSAYGVVHKVFGD